MTTFAPPTDGPSAAAGPPHSLEAEQSVLGAILLSERAMYALVIEEGLKPADFYRGRRQHARIVRDHSLMRRLLNTTYEIQESVAQQQGAPRDLVERAERQMLEVAHDDRQKDFRSVEEVLHTELDKLH